MVEPLRRRQTKEAETDMPDLTQPRHIPTLPPDRPDLRAVVAAFRSRRSLGRLASRQSRAAASPPPRHSPSLQPPARFPHSGQSPRSFNPAYVRSAPSQPQLRVADLA